MFLLIAYSVLVVQLRRVPTPSAAAGKGGAHGHHSMAARTASAGSENNSALRRRPPPWWPPALRANQRPTGRAGGARRRRNGGRGACAHDAQPHCHSGLVSRPGGRRVASPDHTQFEKRREEFIMIRTADAMNKNEG